MICLFTGEPSLLPQSGKKNFLGCIPHDNGFWEISLSICRITVMLAASLEKKNTQQASPVTHICNPNTWEAETGRSGVKVILCYIMSLGYMRPHFKNQRKKGEGKEERGGTMRAKEYSRSCAVALMVEYVSTSSCFLHSSLLCLRGLRGTHQT